MNLQLRDYQSACVDSIFSEWEKVRSTLVVVPTGGGKTIIFAAVAKRLHPGRSIVIAHREELIFQASQKIQNSTGLGCDIEMADLVAATNLFHRNDVIVATVQTLTSSNGKRLQRFKPEDFSALIIDESHHATSQTYRTIIDHFRQNPALKILGVTATPKRFDQAALKQIFDTVAYDFEIADAINGGWLVPLSQQLIRVHGLDWSQCRTTAGDLNRGDVARIVENEKIIHGMAQPSLEVIFGVEQHSLNNISPESWSEHLHANGRPRRTIAFTASVAQAKAMSEIFNRHLPDKCAWVSDETPKERRRQLLKDFASGKTQIITNCGIFTEGFDDPGVEVLIMARPTKSPGLYTQMAGRALRPLPGVVDGPETPELRRQSIAESSKPMAIIVDFTGNSGKHKLMTSMDILGGKVSAEVKQRVKKILEKDEKPRDIMVVISEAEAQLRDEEKRQREREEMERRRKIMARVDYSSRRINPFDYGDVTRFEQPRSRDGHMFTQKQAALLKQNGIDPNKMLHRQGLAIIGRLATKVTEGQKRVLVRAGWWDDTLTKKEASKRIDALAKNHWRKPVNGTPTVNRPTQSDFIQPGFVDDDGPPIEWYDR